MSQIFKNGTKKPKHILDLTAEEKRIFLDSFDIVLSDCDGVVWMVAAPIPNTGNAVNLLKNAGKPFKFVTNNDGMRSDEDYIKKIEKIGAKNIVKDDFILPYKAFARYMKLNYPDEICYVLGTEIFCNSMRSRGVNVVNVTPHFNVSPEELSRVTTPLEAAKVVVVDIHINMTFAELALIHQYLLKEDCKVFINATDDRLPITDELTILGPGLFTKGIADCAGKEMVLFGKPSELMADYMADEFGIKDRKRGIFVGDNLFSDIEFGARHGFQTLFVLSGAHTLKDALFQPLEYQPDYYADSLGDFVEFFNNLTGSVK